MVQKIYLIFSINFPFFNHHRSIYVRSESAQKIKKKKTYLESKPGQARTKTDFLIPLPKKHENKN